MTLVFEPPPPVLATVAGTADLFAVRRIFCVGRNYADHAREMGQDPEREPPFFFTKWAETVIPDGATLPYPQATRNFHYEAELIVAIGRTGRAIAVEHALEMVWGYAVGLDMTRRDLQQDAREAGRPWDTAKNVEHASPLSPLHPASVIGHPSRGRISLKLNGELRQDSDIADMIWSVPEIVSFLSALYRLGPGDLIYTGTPAGVGAVVSGDTLLAEIEGLSPLSITIGPAAK